MTSCSASLGTKTYKVSPGLADEGLKVVRFTVRSAFIAPSTFSECEGRSLGGTAIVYRVFSKFVISKHICIHLCMMAEGGYDPTTENETPWEDHRIDHDDDDEEEEEVNTTHPFQPGASSTPYHGGEAHEMTNMDPEEEGLGDTVPLIPKYDDLVYTEDKETLINRFKEAIKKRAPRVDFRRIVVGLGKRRENQGKAVAFGPRGGETVIFKQDNTFTAAFSRQYSGSLGPSSEEVIAEDNTALRDTGQRIKEAQQLEASLNVQVEKQKQEAQELKQLEDQLEQINQRIDKKEQEGGGTLMEQQMETDRLKQQSAKLKRDIKAAKEKEKGYAQTVKERDKASKEVARLQRQYTAQEQERNATEKGLNSTKPLESLEQRYETLNRTNEEDQRVIDDENATSSDKQAAEARMEERREEKERLGPQIQQREEALPLRERVKNIFKKYGWTLQAVALAVGIVLSALALAGMNGLKAGTKAVGRGLQAIGKKLGSLLPGLIGSIVSFIFKAAGQVFSFLAEHAWLLILAVVAFFMERLLKKRRR